MMWLGFLFEKKILARLKKRTIFALIVFCYKNKLVFPIYVSNQKFEKSMDLSLIIDSDKSHVYIKDFDRFMFHKTKNKTKNTFAKVVYSVLVVKMC